MMVVTGVTRQVVGYAIRVIAIPTGGLAAACKGTGAVQGVMIRAKSKMTANIFRIETGVNWLTNLILRDHGTKSDTPSVRVC